MEEEVEELPRLFAGLIMAGFASAPQSQPTNRAIVEAPPRAKYGALTLCKAEIDEIVSKTHRSATWRACVQEGMSRERVPRGSVGSSHYRI